MTLGSREGQASQACSQCSSQTLVAGVGQRPAGGPGPSPGSTRFCRAEWGCMSPISIKLP